MSVSGCPKCMKYLLFLLNFIFWICGAAMVGLGVWVLVDYDSFTVVMDNPFLNSAVYLLICIGGIITIVAFLGCCGAAKEHKGCLTGYTAFLFLMFMGEVGCVGIIYYFGSGKVEDTIIDAANKTFVEYGSKQYITSSWDTLQIGYECCGLSGYGDYQYIDWADTNTDEFPDSCCTVVSIESGMYVNTTLCHELNTDFFNAEGCATEMQNFVKDNIFTIAGVLIGIALVQLVGIIGGCCLCCAIKKDD